MKALPKGSHLNDHTIGSHLQTQKFVSPNKTPSFTMGVKGLIWEFEKTCLQVSYILKVTNV